MPSATRPKLNVLVAYPYFSDQVREVLLNRDPSEFRLIIDSGAFTAWNTGAVVTLDGYVKFLRSIPSHWDYRAVTLDVIGDPEGTYDNWRRMLDLGFHDIMPVFTRGDTLERADEFYSVSDYLMFGGIVAGTGNKNYIRWFMERNQGRPVHWLGFVNVPFIKHYRPTSVDSSSLSGTQRFAQIVYYAGAGVLKNLKKADFARHPPRDFIAQTQARGFTTGEIRRLGSEGAWRGAVRPPDPSVRDLRGFASFITYTHHIHRAAEVERNLGTRVYLAFATAMEVAGAFAARDFMIQRGTL